MTIFGVQLLKLVRPILGVPLQFILGVPLQTFKPGATVTYQKGGPPFWERWARPAHRISGMSLLGSWLARPRVKKQIEGSPLYFGTLNMHRGMLECVTWHLHIGEVPATVLERHSYDMSGHMGSPIA